MNINKLNRFPKLLSASLAFGVVTCGFGLAAQTVQVLAPAPTFFPQEAGYAVRVDPQS